MRKVFYLLGQLTDADVEWLIANGARQRVPAGTALIREGEPIEALYVVLGGTLEVAFAGPGGRQTVTLASGEVVGEMSFVDARPPSATVIARADAVVLAVPRSALEAKLEADSAFAARFYRALAVFLSQRLRQTNRRLGYGRASAADEDAEDELGPDVLGSLHLAASRFDRVLQRLLAE